MTVIQERIAAKRPTAAHIQTREIYTRLAADHTSLATRLQPYMLAAGAWELPRSTNQRLFVNPAYAHAQSYGSIDDPDDRRALLERAASVGILDHEDVRRMVGLSTSGLRTWVRRHDVDWVGARRAGLRRMSRTWATIRAWTDHSYHDVAAAFGLDHAYVRSRVSTYVVQDDWTVPDRPYGRPGWRTSRGNDGD